MFAVRLLVGLLKGLIIGGIVGYALAASGMATPAALIAYPLAAGLGMLVALIAGKPIWAKDARIEVGMKAAAGALLAPFFLFLARRFLQFDVPFDVSSLPGLSHVSGTPEVGELALTSFAAVAALLAGFFDADNAPQPPEEADKAAKASKQRVATPKGGAADAEAEQEAAEAEAAERRGRK